LLLFYGSLYENVINTYYILEPRHGFVKSFSKNILKMKKAPRETYTSHNSLYYNEITERYSAGDPEFGVCHGKRALAIPRVAPAGFPGMQTLPAFR
jgi:hypothetical protein